MEEIKLSREQLIEQIQSDNVIITNEELLSVRFKNEISNEELLDVLKKVYDYETGTLELKDKDNVMLFLKGLPISKIVEAIKYSLTREDLRNPLMILNIINIIKISNTFKPEFFSDENIYVSKTAEMLDLRMKLKPYLKEFTKKLNIYFISLFKSYNKTTYTPLDNHKKVPEVFKIIMLSTDILTLSGIFSVGEPFNTSECIFVDDGIDILVRLLNKSAISTRIMESFFADKEKEQQEKEQQDKKE